MKQMRTWSFLFGSVFLFAACSSAPPLTQEAAKPAPAPAPVTTAPMQPSTAMTPKAELTVLPAYLDPRSEISKQRSVYFDYDVFSIKPEFSQVLEMHGKFLSANPKVSIRVQGNADERGGAEYNLALGQKRADAVIRALKVYGVKDSQMESISFGREKPKALGHDEAAWAQNRRVDLDYPTK